MLATCALLVLIVCAAIVLLLRTFPSGAAGLLFGIRACEWAHQSTAQIF
jgi:hypothetical protein